VQIKSQEFNEARAKTEQDFLQGIKPKLDKAIEEVLKSGNYDLVIDRAAVVDVSPKLDITLRVVERLNQMR
jgi:outer membrane protein